MGLHPGLYSVGLSALFGDDPPSQFLSTARQAGALTTIASNHYSINLIITICRFEIKEMTTLFWNFELLQLISVAKIRYNRQNNTTKKIRVDSLYSWLNIFVLFFVGHSLCSLLLHTSAGRV